MEIVKVEPKFKASRYYEHDKQIDVFIQVLIAQNMGKRHFLLVNWWNKGQKKIPYSHAYQQILEIKEEDYINWNNCDWRLDG